MHEDIVIDCIEKLRQVHVNGYFVALTDVLFYLPDTIMGRSTGSETAT